MFIKVVWFTKFFYSIAVIILTAVFHSLSIQYNNALKLHSLIKNKQVYIFSEQQPLKEIILHLFETCLALVLIYTITWQIKIYVNKQLIYYQSKYTNLKPIKKSYTWLLSHLQFTLLNNIWNFPSFLGIFVALLQYFTLGRLTNIIVTLLNLLLNFILTHLAIQDDLVVLKSSQKSIRTIQFYTYTNEINLKQLVEIIREGAIGCMFKSIAELRVGNFIEINQYDTVPVAKAQLVYGNNKNDNISAVFNIEANNGETKTYQQFQVGDYLPADLISLNENPIYVRVIETHNLNQYQTNNQQDRFTETLIRNQTWMSILLCSILFILIEIGKMANIEYISIADFTFDAISAVIAFNYLIPQMKSIPVSIIRALSLVIWSKKQEIVNITSDVIKSKNHKPADQYIDTQVECYKLKVSKPIMLISDKTGSLTTGNLTIKHHIIDKSNNQSIDLHNNWENILLSINSTFQCDIKNESLKNNNNFYANSPEERVIGEFLYKKYNFQFLQSNIEYNKWIEYNKYVKFYTLPFTNGVGRISWVINKRLDYNTNTYHSYFVVQYQSEQLAKIIDFKNKDNIHNLSDNIDTFNNWTPWSADRSLMIAALPIPVNYTMDDFNELCSKYKTALLKQEIIIGLTRIAEFYFDDPLRTNTVQGVNLLNKKQNISLLLCTGDSMTTAQYIGQQIGMSKDTLSIDGTTLKVNDLNNNDNNNNSNNNNILPLDDVKFENHKNIILGKFTATQKAQLVQYLQDRYPNHIVMMFGDQKNDQLAIMNSQYGFVQSQGCLDCKIVAQVQVDSLLGIYNYLFYIRRLRLFGQYWLINQFHIFNCILAAICLMGLHVNGFSKKSLLFIDPWNPVRSLIMTNFIAITLIIASYKIGDYCTADHVGYNNMMSSKKLLFKSFTVFITSLLVAYISRFFVSIDSYLAIVVTLTFIDSSSLFLNRLLY